MSAPGTEGEVDALRKAVLALLEWDKARGYPIPYRVRDPLRTALAQSHEVRS